VGDTTLAAIKPKLEKLFAGWKPGDVPKKNVAQVPQPEKNTVYLIDRPDSKQSIIFGAQLAPPRNDPMQFLSNSSMTCSAAPSARASI